MRSDRQSRGRSSTGTAPEQYREQYGYLSIPPPLAQRVLSSLRPVSGTGRFDLRCPSAANAHRVSRSPLREFFLANLESFLHSFGDGSEMLVDFTGGGTKNQAADGISR